MAFVRGGQKGFCDPIGAREPRLAECFFPSRLAPLSICRIVGILVKCHATLPRYGVRVDHEGAVTSLEDDVRDRDFPTSCGV